MKTRILLPILFLASMLLFSCKKENNAPGNGNGSSQSNTGTLYFQNTKADPYTIYLDGVNQGILQPSATSGGYTVTTGITHNVKAVQRLGACRCSCGAGFGTGTRSGKTAPQE